MNQKARPPAGKGCFFYGCLTFTVLLLVVAVATFFGVRYLQTLLHTYTDTASEPLPRVVLSPDEMQELIQRLSAFENALFLGTATEPLVIAEEELNALLDRQPDLLEWSQFLYITLEEGQIRGLISLPLEEITRGPFRSPRFEGRYLNATVDLNFTITNATPVLNIESATVKGEPVPNQVMEVLREQNLAGEMEEVPPRIWRNIDPIIQVEKGRAIIFPVQRQVDPAPAPIE